MMETKLKGNEVDRVRRQLQFEYSLVVPSIRQSGGLMLLWRNETKVSIRSYSKGHIDAAIQEGCWSWRFIGIYGNPVRGLHHERWRLMTRLAEQSDIPWVLGGDFNEITDGSEKKGGSSRAEADMRDFQEAIDCCGVLDPGFIDLKYTWSNKHTSEEKLVLERE
ncbi:MAG: hypothetical protein Q8754_02860 [Sweet potato little leaf phytoplasma]|nr:hypothetical protein [Sweet potato little leaf phytoplasma]